MFGKQIIGAEYPIRISSQAAGLAEAEAVRRIVVNTVYGLEA